MRVERWPSRRAFYRLWKVHALGKPPEGPKILENTRNSRFYEFSYRAGLHVVLVLTFTHRKGRGFGGKADGGLVARELTASNREKRGHDTETVHTENRAHARILRDRTQGRMINLER